MRLLLRRIAAAWIAAILLALTAPVWAVPAPETCGGCCRGECCCRKRASQGGPALSSAPQCGRRCCGKIGLNHGIAAVPAPAAGSTRPAPPVASPLSPVAGIRHSAPNPPLLHQRPPPQV